MHAKRQLCRHLSVTYQQGTQSYAPLTLPGMRPTLSALRLGPRALARLRRRARHRGMQRPSALERQPRRASLEQPHGVVVAHRRQHELCPACRSAAVRPSRLARPARRRLPGLWPRSSGASCRVCAKPCPRPFSCPPGLPACSLGHNLGLLPAQPAHRRAVPHMQRRAPHALRACARSMRTSRPVWCLRHSGRTDDCPVTDCQQRRRL